MANMNLKKDFADGEKLPAKDLNNNFAVIEECLNNTEKAPSTYEIAKQNGFIGTEEEWLATLVGPQGIVGPEGNKGKPAFTRGYALFQVGAIGYAEGYDNVFSDYTKKVANIEIEPLQKDNIMCLSINTEVINKIALHFGLFYNSISVSEPVSNFVECIIDVYDEDMTLIKTYKQPYSNPMSNPSLEGSFNIDFFIDTSLFDKYNLVMKVNVLRYGDNNISEGNLFIDNTSLSLEAFV